MIRKVCPICDQVMKSAHYCRNCRSWVRHPYVQDVNYYLNERHPEQETACTYHEDTESQASERGKSRTYPNRPRTGQSQANQARTRQSQPNQARTARSQPNQPWTRQDQANRPRAGQSRPNQTDPGRKRAGQVMRPSGGRSADSDKIRVSWILITVIVVILFLGSCASMSSMVVGSILGMREYDIDLGAYTGEDEDWAGYSDYDYQDYQILEDEEVMALGKACTESSHMSVTMPEIKEPILEILKARGFSVVDIDTTSYNVDYGDGYCWYSTDCMFYLDDSWDQYVDINCDTATGDVHEIAIAMKDTGNLVAVTGDTLSFLKRQEIIGSDDEFFVGMQEVLADAAEAEEDFFVSDGCIVVQGWSSYDGVYCAYISLDE